MNAFRNAKDSSLDREYLRICAISKLCRKHRLSIGGAKFLASLPIRGFYKKASWLEPTIEIWYSNYMRAHK